MAKKILAVVLAVMMAVSAMAISAFADETIPLYPSNGNWTTTVSDGISFTLDLPYYALYGYTTNEFALEVNLPKNINNFAGATMDWYITVNGVTSQMKPVAVGSTYDNKDLDTQYVFFAPLAHGYVADGTLWTSVPQSTGFGDTPSIRLTAVYKLSGNNANAVGAGVFAANGQHGNNVNVKVVKADSVPGNAADKPLEYVPGAATYAKDWTYSDEAGTTSSSNVTYDFVTNEWSVGAENAATLANPLMFDHNFKNRSIILDAWSSNATVELHVPLNKEINGIATYTLYAKTDESESPYWWNYSNKRKLVKQITVDGATKELVFPVPAEMLYDSNYQSNAYNVEFVIFENINLMIDNLMSDYLHKGPGATGDGSFGDISWVNWSNSLNYKGKAINYARTGKAGVGVTGNVADNKTYQSEVLVLGHEIKDATTIKVEKDRIYKLTFLSNEEANSTDAHIAFVKAGSWWQGDGNFVGFGKEIKGSDLIEKLGMAEGDPISILSNQNSSNKSNTTVLLESYKYTEGLTGLGLGADVMTTGAYLLVKSEEQASEPEKVDPPTEAPGTTDDPEQNPGDIDVGDSDEEKKDENPKTGVALALVPMMIAAAAAVVSKKH